MLLLPPAQKEPLETNCSHDAIGSSGPLWVLHKGGPCDLCTADLVFVPVGLEYLAPLPTFPLGLIRKRFINFKMIKLLNGLKKEIVNRKSKTSGK